MTKKAAKKKQVTKKRVSKKAASSAEETSESGPEEVKTEDSLQEPAEVSSDSTPGSSEPGIEVVQETAAEADAPKKKIGRVQQPDGGRKRDSSRSRSGGRRGGKRNSGPRPQVDQEELGKKAWKIFQHEIAEEGLALIDEISARQLAEKSLVVTRAFLEERERRLGRMKAEESSTEAPTGDTSEKRKNEGEFEKVDAPTEEEKAVADGDPSETEKTE